MSIIGAFGQWMMYVPLFSLLEMQRADNILAELFEKAGAGNRYSGRFYSGQHKFDLEMQRDAFDWFDQWLQA